LIAIFFHDRIRDKDKDLSFLAHWRDSGGLIEYPLSTLCGSSAQNSR
jgi:hypothetical protein